MYLRNHHKLSFGRHSDKLQSGVATVLVMLFSVILLMLCQIRIRPKKTIPKTQFNVIQAPQKSEIQKRENTVEKSHQLLPELSISDEMLSVPSLENVPFELSTGTGALKPEIQGSNIDLKSLSVDTVTSLDLFEMEELDFPPTLIRRPGFQFPKALLREGITSGYIVLEVEIDTHGRARIIQVLDVSNQALVVPAQKAVQQALFQSPQKDARAVNAHYEWKLNLNAN